MSGLEGRSGSNLGSSLIRQQFSTKIVSEKAIVETERGKSKLRSVTQCDDLEELMSNAVLAGTDFRSQRGEMIIVGSEARQEGERVRAPEGTEVPIPRRPPWRDVASAEELEQNERMAFLDWRRELADMEEVKGYLLTPYEKNLEVWRQLWRVLERARLIVQIVDARNPLLFRCADLEAYVRELDASKRCILLINKADLLTETQRKIWARHFQKAGISFVFWSAAAAQEALDEEARRERAAWIDPSVRAHMKAQGLKLSREERRQTGAVDISDGANAAASKGGPAAGRSTKGRAAAAAKGEPAYQSNYAEGAGGATRASAGGEAAKPRAAAVAAIGDAARSSEEDDDEDEDEDEDALLRRMAGRSSAKAAGMKAAIADVMPSDEEEADVSNEDEAGDEDDKDEDEEGWETDEGADEPSALGVASASVATSAKTGATHVHTREELLELLERLCPPAPKGTQAGGIDGMRSCIGMVGYPNVGKSSTVNVLAAAKKTNVSSTPGKTKHFQTLSVPDNPNMVLCDCPGLVFPTVAGSKAQMVCDGILPIDQMKSDYLSPIRLLCERLPPHAFEQCYALKLRSDEERAEDPDMHDIEHELLTAHALARGFMTATKGSPDESRSARVILKDLVNAKLLHTVAPPSASPAEQKLFGARGGVLENDDGGAAGGACGGAADGAGPCESRKVPSVPTTARWLGQMKADYEAQAGVGAHFSKGRKKAGHSKHEQRMKNTVANYQNAPTAAMRAAQWRPMGASALPDRIVASGPRVELRDRE